MIDARPSLALMALAAGCGGMVETIIPPAPDSGSDVSDFDDGGLDRFVASSAPPPPPDPDAGDPGNPPPPVDWPFTSCGACGSSHTGHAAR